MYSLYDPVNRKSNVHHLTHWWSVSLIALVLFLSWFTKHRLQSLPEPLNVNDFHQVNKSFIAERAWHDLNILTSFGPRPTGSHANEVNAIDFLKRELSFIQRDAHPNQKIYSDNQIVSGGYFVGFKPHPMTNIYRNVQNFVVRLAGSDENENSLTKNHSLMLNCHFDSVAGSPGASDDAASCCVMLELLRVLSRSETRLRHTVLFLFNGAEETPLQAAHGFITKHEWAKDVRAFLNLESVGSNGKEILFQSGPSHGWLIDMYKNAVPHPNGQVAAEELFHLGLIPSDTDFRIFRDYGHVPGMDFAHIFNGYRYHTKYDHIDYIPEGVLQRTGDNILALVKLIADSDELTNTQAYATGRMVYFDFLGYFFVAYTESTGQLLHIAVAAFSLILSYTFLNTKGAPLRNLRKEIHYGFLVTIFSFFLGCLICYLIAFELDWRGKSMSWYSRTYFSIILYCLPTLAIASFFYVQLTRTRDSPLSLALQTQGRLNGVNIVWASGCIILTAFGYRSAYVLMFPVLISLIVNIVTSLTRSQNTIQKWLYIHICGQVFIISWASHFYHLIISVFIPIAGRSGGQHNPDIPIGLITCFFTFFIGSYLIPLVGLLKNPKSFLFTIVAVFILTRLSFELTHIDFPYSDDPANPTPQRHFITHTVRKVYDLKGRIQHTDSGYWFREFDRNVEKTIDSLVAPDTPVRQEEIPMCSDLPFCGLPMYSCRQLHTGGFWLPAPAPILEQEVRLNATKMNLSNNRQQLKLLLNGSFLFSLQIRPKKGVALVKWNLLDEVPEPNQFYGVKAYFAMVTHGLEAPPMNVELEFETTNALDSPLVDISIVTFHWEFRATPVFANLLARMPKWAFPVPSIASLQAFTF